MDRKYIMALDQGTTSSRAILFDKVKSSIEEYTLSLIFLPPLVIQD